MPWIRKQLRGKKIWARCDRTGKLATDEKRQIDIIYSPRGRIYQASLSNVGQDDEVLMLTDEEAAPGIPADGLRDKKIEPKKEKASPSLPAQSDFMVPKEAIRVYTDGACTGNPGPMGIGVVVLDPVSGTRHEYSQYLGHGTNNIAELTAIKKGLQHVPSSRTIAIFSDSAYAIGVLSKNWKAKANQELIETIRQQIRQVKQIYWVKVLGHSGILENERCDELARIAILKKQ